MYIKVVKEKRFINFTPVQWKLHIPAIIDHQNNNFWSLEIFFSVNFFYWLWPAHYFIIYITTTIISHSIRFLKLMTFVKFSRSFPIVHSDHIYLFCYPTHTKNLFSLSICYLSLNTNAYVTMNSILYLCILL